MQIHSRRVKEIPDQGGGVGKRSLLRYIPLLQELNVNKVKQNKIDTKFTTEVSYFALFPSY